MMLSLREKKLLAARKIFVAARKFFLAARSINACVCATTLKTHPWPISGPLRRHAPQARPRRNAGNHSGAKVRQTSETDKHFGAQYLYKYA